MPSPCRTQARTSPAVECGLMGASSPSPSRLPMQNMRFDLLRLRSAGVGAVVNDLTQATQQARALSRDVDHAIAAASEVREALG